MCVDWWDGGAYTSMYVQVNSGEEVLGFTKFSVGSLSQEKSKAATLSEVQDSVQNLNPSKHSLEHCSLTYRHRSGLPCSLTPPIPSVPSSSHSGAGTSRKKGLCSEPWG